MIIIKKQITEQTFKVMPRELTENVNLYLVDKEQEDNVINENVLVTIENGFINVPFTASFLKEGRKYHIRIDNLSGVRIWQGLALCTDKTDLQNYKIYE